MLEEVGEIEVHGRRVNHAGPVGLNGSRRGRLRPAGRGVAARNVVCNPVAHLGPAPLAGEVVQFVGEVVPAVQFEDRPVRRRRAVEGDLAARHRPGGLDRGLVAPGHDEDRAADLEVAPSAPGALEAALDRRQRHLAQVAFGREAVRDEAVGDLAGELRQPSTFMAAFLTPTGHPRPAGRSGRAGRIVPLAAPRENPGLTLSARDCSLQGEAGRPPPPAPRTEASP